MHQGVIVARKMSPEREQEFDELSKFLEYYCTEYERIDRNDDIHPSNVLVKIVEKYGRSQALQGLKQAIHDTIEDSLDFKPEKLKSMDQDLFEKGIISISALRLRYWKKYKKIIEHHNIKNETEYYLIVGVLNDLSIPIKAQERKVLTELVGSYEQNA